MFWAKKAWNYLDPRFTKTHAEKMVNVPKPWDKHEYEYVHLTLMDNLSEFTVNQADTYLWLAHPEVPFGFPARGQRQKKMRT